MEHLSIGDLPWLWGYGSARNSDRNVAPIPGMYPDSWQFNGKDGES
jgi:hypothetical protein